MTYHLWITIQLDKNTLNCLVIATCKDVQVLFQILPFKLET